MFMLLFIIKRYNQKKIIIHNNINNTKKTILTNIFNFSKTNPTILHYINNTFTSTPKYFNKSTILYILSPIINLSNKINIFSTIPLPKLTSRNFTIPFSTNVYLTISYTPSIFTSTKYILSSTLLLTTTISFTKS